MNRLVLISIGCLLFMLVGACDNDDDKFSGLSDLVAERQGVRKEISKENLRKKKDTKRQAADKMPEEMVPRETQVDDLTAVVLYEKKVEIVDSQTRESLAKGVAYMSKKGRIVRIKITKE